MSSLVPLYAAHHAFGWTYDPAGSARALQEIARTQSSPVLFSDAAADWIGLEDDDHPFFAWKAEEKVLGSVKPSWNQGSAGTCHAAGTLVRMADGSGKPIEDVAVGEMVVTHRYRPRVVREVFKIPYSGTMIRLVADADKRLGGGILSTPDHRFAEYSERENADWKDPLWRRADLLAPGKDVLMFNGERTKLVRADAQEGFKGHVYCLEVAEDHSFVANGYAAANCVSFGWGRGCNDLLLLQAAAGLSEWPGAEVATEPIYGGSRVEVGGGSIWGDGSVGTWAAKWVKDWGVLLRKKYLDKYDLSSYSVNLSRSWGRSGVPDDLEPVAKQFPVKAVALVTSAKEAWAALGTGRVVPICSNWGFDSPLEEGFCRPSGTWNHCMLLRARMVCKCRGKTVRGFGCQNSWGDYIRGDKVAFSALEGGKAIPLPEGLFFIEEEYVDKILSQKDSCTISDVDGFPLRELSWLF